MDTMLFSIAVYMYRTEHRTRCYFDWRMACSEPERTPNSVSSTLSRKWKCVGDPWNLRGALLHSPLLSHAVGVLRRRGLLGLGVSQRTWWLA